MGRPLLGSLMTTEIRSSVIRVLTHELYLDAPLDEVAEAAETTVHMVKAVLDDMALRRCLAHARMVSEQMGLGLDEQPDAVITMALEYLYASAPRSPAERRQMQWFLRQLGPGGEAPAQRPR